MDAERYSPAPLKLIRQTMANPAKRLIHCARFSNGRLTHGDVDAEITMNNVDSSTFDELQCSLQQDGPDAAIEKLCTTLRDKKDYASLFYALLLRKRHELGVSPIPTGSSQDLPEAAHAPYEEAIRQAGRLIGNLYLEDADIPHAWLYYRMIGETEPISTALDKVKPAEGEDVQPLVEIAYHHGIHPKRGFDLLLENFGLCSAITTVSSGEFPHSNDVRTYCIQRLVRALYDELRGRLGAEIAAKEGREPAPARVSELMAGRDWLFEDEFYHVDVSHLGAVVQMSVHLPPGEELDMARELCQYGQKLSTRFQYAGDPPFEDQYRDYGIYLDTLAGVDVEKGIAHFRAKLANSDPEEVGTAPAEVLVNLLLRVNRPQEALAIARQYLAAVDGRRLACPTITELCQRANDFQTLADVAREQSDAVHFLAGLLADRTKRPD